MSGRTKPLTIAFYLAFALWFIAMSYSGPGFYGWFIHPLAQLVLGLAMWVIFFAVVVVVSRRSLSLASVPWLDLAVFGCVLIALNLYWHLYLSRHAWDAYKLTSIVVDAATPIIVAIGIAAFMGEWRQARQLSC